MENIRNFVKQNLKLILFILCGVLAVAGILIFVLGAGDSEGFIRVMFVLFGIVIELLAISVAFMAIILDPAQKANFFLYDSKLKSNITVDELNFDIVNNKMTFVMTKLTSSATKVWSENVFEADNEIFDDDTYVPLVAYKIIYDLCDRPSETGWKLYLAADANIIDSIVAGLEMNEDAELAKAFKFLHSNASGDHERTAKFLGDNKKYIQTKMVKYVKANIEKF